MNATVYFTTGHVIIYSISYYTVSCAITSIVAKRTHSRSCSYDSTPYTPPTASHPNPLQQERKLQRHDVTWHPQLLVVELQKKEAKKEAEEACRIVHIAPS